MQNNPKEKNTNSGYDSLIDWIEQEDQWLYILYRMLQHKFRNHPLEVLRRKEQEEMIEGVLKWQ